MDRQKPLRVLTYNIRKGKGPFRGEGSISALAAGLMNLEADVVLCQEVFHQWDDDGVRQSDELAKSLSFLTAYGANASYSKGHHGNATLSRFAIRTMVNRDVSTNRFEKRGVLYSLLDCEWGALHVFNTHLGLNRVQRQKQVHYIADMISEICTDEHPVLLAGDFNDWTGRLDREIVGRCGLHNALEMLAKEHRRSWPSFRPVFNLDRIYFRGLHLMDVRVLNDAPWSHLSDHLPVTADFEVERP